MPQFITAPQTPWLERLCSALGGVAILALWGMWMAQYVIHGPVDERRLAVSVGDGLGRSGRATGEFAPCRRVSADGRWSCQALGGSGGDRYRVRVREGSSCWTARRSKIGDFDGTLPARGSGCVRLWQGTLWSGTLDFAPAD